MFASFNHFEIELTKKQAESSSHQGKCDDDIKALLKIPSIRKQLEKLNPEDIKTELKECGAWNDEELSNTEDNFERILWIACGNIMDELK